MLHVEGPGELQSEGNFKCMGSQDHYQGSRAFVATL